MDVDLNDVQLWDGNSCRIVIHKGSPIGAGGFGSVFTCDAYRDDISTGTEVLLGECAIKLLDDPEQEDRFKQEILIMKKLVPDAEITWNPLDSYNGHIPVYASGECDCGDGIQCYYMMPRYVGSLADHIILNGKLVPDKARKVVLTLAEIMDSAHDKNVVHIDLKPENILLDAEGHMHVCDWGLAYASGETVSKTERLTLLLSNPAIGGTHDFTDPAAFSFGTQKLEMRSDPKSDMFSLGKILQFITDGDETDNENLKFVTKMTSAQRNSRPVNAGELKELFSDSMEWWKIIGQGVVFVALFALGVAFGSNKSPPSK